MRFTAFLLFCMCPTGTGTKPCVCQIDEKCLSHGGDVIGRGVRTDNAGNVYVAGSFTWTADMDLGPGRADVTSAGGNDIFMARFNDSGKYKYAIAVGGKYDDDVMAMDIDDSGNVYITGYFQDTVDFDPGPGTAILTAGGNQAIFIAKYDALGKYVYARATGNVYRSDPNAGSNARSIGIAVGDSGNIYISGYFWGTYDFDPGLFSLAFLTSINGLSDVFIAKYDHSGNYVYARSVGGSSDDYGHDIAVDRAGNACIVGSYPGKADFDPGDDTAYLTSKGTTGLFIAKYDASGKYLYAKGIEGTDFFTVKIATDASGNIYVTGSFAGTADFDPGAGTAYLTSIKGDYSSIDVFFARYDTTGAYVYAKAIGGPWQDIGGDITVGSMGNVYLTGNFSGAADFDPGTGTANLYNAGVADIFVAGYDASGNYTYARAMGGKDNDYGNSIDADALGNAYVTGSFTTTADFDQGTGKIILTVGSYGINAFVYRFSHAGNLIAASQLGNYVTDILTEEGKSIAADRKGRVYVTGNFAGTVDFDPGPGTANLTGKGFDDIFIACYDATGKYVYAKAMGSETEDFSYGIAVDDSGYTYHYRFIQRYHGLRSRSWYCHPCNHRARHS